MRRCRAPRCCGPFMGSLIFTSPLNPERYRLWAEFLGTDPNPIKIRPTYVCEIHFERKYLSILNGKTLRLLSGSRARPTIHCHGPDKDIAVGTKTPSPACSSPPPTEGNLGCDRLSSGDMQDCPGSKTPSPKHLLPTTSTPIPRASSPPSTSSCSVHLFPSPSPSEPLAVPLLDVTNVSGSSCSTQVSHLTVDRELTYLARQTLTPRKRRLINIARTLKKKIRRTSGNLNRARLTIKDLLDDSNGPTKFIENFSQKLTPAAAVFFAAQLRTTTQKARARRWSLDEKLLFLSIKKRSPKSYSLLSSLFSLPTSRTLTKFLNQIPLEPGINRHVFESLSNSLRGLGEDHRICSLMFDEMSIREHVQYDPKTDRFLGFENLGLAGRGSQTSLARQALVFIVRGLVVAWKQPVAFYFTRDGISSEMLVTLLQEVLVACKEAGVIVVSTVCDMSSRNVKAMRMMGVTEKMPYFFLDEEKVVALFDVPHLLKCTRNMMYRNHIKVPLPLGGNEVSLTSSWEHVRTAVMEDAKQFRYRHLSKITERHLDPRGQDAMTVSLAAQVMSHTMASCLSGCVSSNTLPTAALATATVCGEMNKLFDSLNGVGVTPGGEDGMKCSLQLEKEDLHLKFWSTTVKLLECWKYSRNKVINGKLILEEFVPPSHRGWLQTLFDGLVASVFY